MPSFDIVAVDHVGRELERGEQIGNPIFVEENSCYVPVRNFNGVNLSAYHVVKTEQEITSTKMDQSWVDEHIETIKGAFKKVF
jgi:hypothetical protein